MSTYVMADLHGRFTELREMLRKINFGAEDKLIIAGDICDRGKENYAMLKWMESKPANVEFVKGNPGKKAIIGSLEKASDAINGMSGTVIINN